MPIMKPNQSCVKKDTETSKTGVTRDAKGSWPQLLAGDNEEPAQVSIATDSDASTEEWENLSDVAMDTSVTNIPKGADTSSKKIVHRCMSTPELAHIHDDDSYVLDFSEKSVSDQSLATNNSVTDNAVLLSHTKATSTTMKKVPSFKDIMMLNAQKHADDEKKKQQMVIEHQRKLRKEAAERRKSNKPKMVITPIKRCTKSTGDLRSFVIHEEPEDGDFGGGGGGGGTIHEDEVLGDTDAMDFYHRKSKGSLNRQNGAKTRPDEAKRKEMIIHKKNAQRKAQEARR